MDESDVFEIELTESASHEPELFVPLERRMLSTPEATHGHVRVRIGTRPLVTSLRHSMGAHTNDQYRLLDMYDVWRVDCAVGIDHERSSQSARCLSLALTFPESPRVTIIGTLPQTELITRGELGLEVTAKVVLPFQVSGAWMEMEPSDKIQDNLLETRVSGHLVWGVRYPVLSARVVSTGFGDMKARWVIHRDRGSLLGNHVVTAFIIVPRHRKKLEAKAELSVVVPGIFGVPVALRAQTDLLLVPTHRQQDARQQAEIEAQRAAFEAAEDAQLAAARAKLAEIEVQRAEVLARLQALEARAAAKKKPS